MSARFHDLAPRSLEARLASLALVLGVIALFGAPRGGETVTINSRELAAIVETEVDHVTVQELSDWIIDGRGEMRLIDLRSPEDYADYRIPGAENVALTSLIEYPLYRNEKIVLYSGGGLHSAQAWFLLQAHGFQGTYILLGGLEAWKDEILFPALPANATADQLAEFHRTSAVSSYFGGSPQTAAGSASAVAATQLPKVAMPAAPGVQVQRKRKAKEGC